MSTLPQYRQGKLTSRLVGTPGLDTSGKQMVEAGLQARGTLLDAEVAAHGAAAHGVEQLMNAASGVLGGGIQGFQQGYQHAAAKKQAIANKAKADAEKLAVDQKSGQGVTAMNQQYLDHMNSLNKAGTGMMRQRIYPTHLSRFKISKTKRSTQTTTLA
jgi:hypothetical protein